MWSMIWFVLKETNFKTWLYIICIGAVSAWNTYRVWDKTTAENCSDPINWLVVVFFVIMYLVGRKNKIL